MKVLFVAGDPKPERWTVPIKQLLPEADIYVWDPDGPAINADYAIVWQPPAKLFERETRLKAVFNLGAGIDGLLKVPNLPADLTVVRLEDAGMSVQMAEHVLHQILEVSRQMELYRDQQRQRLWKIHRPISRKEWPIGIMGLGHIGKRVASTLASLDYTVNGWARSEHTVEGVRTFAGNGQLGEFLGATRVLVNTLPLTSETENILNYDLFSQLQPGAVLINVGRGSTSWKKTCSGPWMRRNCSGPPWMCSARNLCRLATHSGSEPTSQSRRTFRRELFGMPRWSRSPGKSGTMPAGTPSQE